MINVSTALILWMSDDGVPERLVYEGRPYRVTDRPTPLEFDIGWVTHLPPLPAAWRFQGTDEERESVMFEIVQSGDDWRVLRTYR